MNTTEQLMHQAPHRHNDVRPTSQGSGYPFGVILHLDELGKIQYRGFHATRGITTGRAYYDRNLALKALQVAVREQEQ